MTKQDKDNIEENDIIEEMEAEVEDLENEEELDSDEVINIEPVDEKCIDRLARTVADYENFKKRVERDKQDMIFFIKSDILKKLLPRFDDLDRIIKNTKEENKDTPLYEWAIAMQKAVINDLDKLWVKSFVSKWEDVNPDFHDVMTTVPWQKEWVIIDEFETWYMLWDRVLRHARVVAGWWE